MSSSISDSSWRFACNDRKSPNRSVGLTEVTHDRKRNGPGYGSSCFPKDTLALSRIAQDCGAPCRLVETTIAVNEACKGSLVARVAAACGGSVCGKTLTVLDLTFKPETDDVLDAVSLPISSRLVEEAASIRAFDPEGMVATQPLLSETVTYCRDAKHTLEGADCLVLITEWNEFRTISSGELAQSLTDRLVVDLKNVFDPAAMYAASLRYLGLGRPFPARLKQQANTVLRRGANRFAHILDFAAERPGSAMASLPRFRRRLGHSERTTWTVLHRSSPPP